MALAHSPRIVTDGLVLCLDAGNTKSYPGSGTTWTDLSGNGNNGTLVNGVGYSNGSLSFDGSDDYISSVSIPNPNGELTCEVAINYDSKGAYHNIFDRGASRPMLWIDPNNKLEVSFRAAAGGITSSDAYNGQDIVVTAVYNSNSSPGILLYVNGNLVGTQNTTHVTWANPSTFTLFNRGNSQTFDGKLYYLKFYTKALTASEVLQNYNALKGRFLT
jgi:dipeptidyl aminopeptidase/acylaminoacyl peptidase